eukprot:s2430_g13.t1
MLLSIVSKHSVGGLCHERIVASFASVPCRHLCFPSMNMASMDAMLPHVMEWSIEQTGKHNFKPPTGTKTDHSEKLREWSEKSAEGHDASHDVDWYLPWFRSTPLTIARQPVKALFCINQ